MQVSLIEALAKWLPAAAPEELLHMQSTIRSCIALLGSGSLEVRHAVSRAATTLATPAVLHATYGSAAAEDSERKFMQVCLPDWHSRGAFKLPIFCRDLRMHSRIVLLMPIFICNTGLELQQYAVRERPL